MRTRLFASALGGAVRAVERGLVALLVAAIAVYRAAISPMLGGRCRFYPSCSEYAVEALRHHGLLRGGARTLGRLARCHPFHPGGYDPPVADSADTRVQS
jgi:putative membrane protein insertion efficiency factor